MYWSAKALKLGSPGGLSVILVHVFISWPFGTEAREPAKRGTKAMGARAVFLRKPGDWYEPCTWICCPGSGNTFERIPQKGMNTYMQV